MGKSLYSAKFLAIDRIDIGYYIRTLFFGSQDVSPLMPLI